MCHLPLAGELCSHGGATVRPRPRPSRAVPALDIDRASGIVLTPSIFKTIHRHYADAAGPCWCLSACRPLSLPGVEQRPSRARRACSRGWWQRSSRDWISSYYVANGNKLKFYPRRISAKSLLLWSPMHEPKNETGYRSAKSVTRVHVLCQCVLIYLGRHQLNM